MQGYFAVLRLGSWVATGQDIARVIVPAGSTTVSAWRGRGIALAAKLAAEKAIAARGVEVAYSPLFRENRRALSINFSLGSEIDEDASIHKYYVFRKRFAAPTSFGASDRYKPSNSDNPEWN